MFGNRWFGGSYFGDRYYGDGGARRSWWSALVRFFLRLFGVR